MQEHDSWLDFALTDLKAAQRLLTGDELLIHPALVLAQQCAEKALKGYLFYKNQPPLRTHNLELLVRKCNVFDKEFIELIPVAEELSPHVTTSRYPDSCLVAPDLTTAHETVQRAAEIYYFVLSKII